MKKFVLAILSLFYLCSSIGATIHMHYCMDKLVNLGITDIDHKTCSNCGMKKEDANGCCKDEHKQVKIETDQKATQVFLVSFHPDSPALIVPFIEYHPYFSTSYSFRLPFSNAPPLPDNNKLYLRNRVFLI